MADDANLIPLEDHAGAAVALPAEMTSQPVQTPIAPEAGAPAEVEAAGEIPDDAADAEPDPGRAGILRELVKWRKEAKALRPAAEAAIGMSQRLQARPDVLALLNGEPLPRPTAPVVPEVKEGPSDAELTDLAHSMALYDLNGQPNLEMARKVDAHTRRMVGHAVKTAIETEVAPLRNAMTTDKASATVNDAMGIADQIGAMLPEAARPGWKAFARERLDWLARSNPAQLADPQMAATSLAGLYGLYAMQETYTPKNGNGGVPRPASAPSAVTATTVPTTMPTFTEPSGNRPPSAPVVSDLERSMAKRAGVKLDDWQAALKPLMSGKAGQSHFVLEDD